jgi:hypothetical protein
MIPLALGPQPIRVANVKQVYEASFLRERPLEEERAEGKQMNLIYRPKTNERPPDPPQASNAASLAKPRKLDYVAHF